MEFIELLGAMGFTTLVSVKLAGALADKLLTNRLAKDLRQLDLELNQKLADHTAKVNMAVNAAKAETEAQLRQEVELVLGEAGAEIAYRAAARTRLYQALGPLRFQLLSASTEWTNRVARFGDKASGTYDISLQGHFLKSTAYRLLRLFAIAELIERQIAFADFAVDPDMRALLKFKRQLSQCFSGNDISQSHPQEDWNAQVQHIFSDTVSTLASSMVVTDVTKGVERVARLDEFTAILADPVRASALHPMPTLMSGFSPAARPVLWLRMLASSQLCLGLVEAQGTALGLELQPIDVSRMLELTEDETIRTRKAEFVDSIDKYRRALIAK